MMTFTNWLLEQKGRDDPVGDLARDFQRDLNLKSDTSVHTNFLFSKTYLIRHNACDGALEAYDQAKKEWKASKCRLL